MLASLREADLGPPVRALLCGQGFLVRSEVNGCDVVGVNGDCTVAVELKKHFSTDLLVQALDRQKIADSVYVALPIRATDTAKLSHLPRWRNIERLLKRLEIGLILVLIPDDNDAPPVAQIVFHPIPHPRPRRSPRRRAALLRETLARSDDYNTGGSASKKIVTAYREQAVFILCCLERFGPQTPAQIRQKGGPEKAQNILYRDVYDWFERIGAGVYDLSRIGREALCEWQAVADFQRARLCAANPTAADAADEATKK